MKPDTGNLEVGSRKSRFEIPGWPVGLERLKFCASRWLALFIVLLASSPGGAGELHEAVRADDIRRIDEILKCSGSSVVNSATDKGVTALHLAAALNREPIAALLIAHGADLNARTAGGFTPLHWAAYKDAADTARLLVRMGADVNAKARNGLTPLGWAARQDSRKVAAVLREAGGRISGPAPAVPPRESQIEWKKKVEVSSKGGLDAEKNNDVEARRSLDSRARIENTLQFKTTDTSVILNGEARYELSDMEKSGDPDFLLREAFVEFRKKVFNVRLGRQIVTWGKLDDIVVLDCLSPQDYRWFAFYDKQERKNPVLMLKCDYYGDEYHLEGVFLPLFEPSEIDFFGTDWAMFDHLKEAVEENEYPAELKQLVQQIDIEDNESSNHVEGGARLRGAVNDVDYALYYMTFYNRLPAIGEHTSKGLLTKRFLFEPTQDHLSALAAANPIIEDLMLGATYDRVHAVGIDFETVMGAYGVRGECGYFSELPYVRESDFSSVLKKSVSAGIGIDHMMDNNLYWNLQWVGDLVLDYEDLFGVDDFSQQLALNLSKDFLLGDLLLDVTSAYRLTYGDWMIRPQVTYKVGHGVELTCGGFVLEGDSTSLFGRYDDNDLIYAEVKYQY